MGATIRASGTASWTRGVGSGSGEGPSGEPGGRAAARRPQRLHKSGLLLPAGLYYDNTHPEAVRHGEILAIAALAQVVALHP